MKNMEIGDKKIQIISDNIVIRQIDELTGIWNFVSITKEELKQLLKLF